MLTLTKKYEILREGAFAIPFSVFEPISNYLAQEYKKFVDSGKTRPNIKPKIFNLDFTGTRFEFLNDYNPKVKVFIYKNSKPVSATFWVIDRETNQNTIQNYGNIYINFNRTLDSILSGTVEHELLHYIQFLIVEHRDAFGGLPSKKFIPKDINQVGSPKNPDMYHKKKSKRFEHTRNPIEYYTNLNTVLRYIQNNYAKFLNWSEKSDTLENRKKYFKNRLDAIKTELEKGTDLFQILKSVKDVDDFYRKNPKISPKKFLYNHYLKILYKAFVNNENPADFDQIENILIKNR